MGVPVAFQSMHLAIEATQRRASALAREVASCDRVDARARALEAIQELSSTLEELRVADEEIRAQNDELSDMVMRLREEHEASRELFAFAPVALLITDRDGAVREANGHAEQLLSRARRCLIGKPIATLIGEGARREFRDLHSDAVNDGEARSWVVTLAPVEGRVAMCVVRAAPDGAGERCRVIRWAFQDVTELARAKTEVRKAEHEMWQRVVDRTAVLTAENERLKGENERLRAAAG